MARKTKLTEEMLSEIADCIRLGMSYAATAGAVGVSDTSFMNWMNWGKAGKKDPIYTRLYAEVQNAESKLMHDCLLKLRKSAETGNAESIRWLLERRFPADFGKKNAVDITAKTENVNMSLNSDMSKNDSERLRREILEKLTPKQLPDYLK